MIFDIDRLFDKILKFDSSEMKTQQAQKAKLKIYT